MAFQYYEKTVAPNGLPTRLQPGDYVLNVSNQKVSRMTYRHAAKYGNANHLIRLEVQDRKLVAPGGAVVGCANPDDFIFGLL